MAAPWPTNWRVYTKDEFCVGDLVGDESPATIDIVGNEEFPAVFFQFENNTVFFRMRLDRSPIALDDFNNFNWGVLLNTNENDETYQWLLTVNGSGGVNGTIELWENLINQPPNSFADQAEGISTMGPPTPNYTEPVTLGDNVRIVPTGDGSDFNGNPDFFIEWQINFTTLSSFLNITELSPLSFCFYTATSNRVPNKDKTCGRPRTLSECFGDTITLRPLPPGTGILNIQKAIHVGPTIVEENTSNTWHIEIIVQNIGTGPVNNVVMTDDILLDTVTDVTVVEKTPGTGDASYDPVTKRLTWNVGTLNAGDAAIIRFDITGIFTMTGNRELNEANVTGIDPNEGNLFAGPARGAAIIVVPTGEPTEPLINVEKNIIDGPLTIPQDQASAWEVRLTVTNTGNTFLSNVILSDLIELDDILSVDSNVNKGTATFENRTITWVIGDLNIGETVTGFFQISGTFRGCGSRFLNRAIVTGTFAPEEGDPIIVESNISSGSVIDVLCPTEFVETVCVITDKVYSHCQQRECFEDVSFDIDCFTFENIKFKSGFIVDGTLNISPITNRPNFKRVRFTIRIPFEVETEEGTNITGYLPDIFKDIVLFIPDNTRDEFNFKIVVETSSKVLGDITQSDNLINFAAGVFIIIKVVGRVQLLIPAFGFCPEPPRCEEFSPDGDICEEFMNQGFPEFFPPQYEDIEE